MSSNWYSVGGNFLKFLADFRIIEKNRETIAKTFNRESNITPYSTSVLRHALFIRLCFMDTRFIIIFPLRPVEKNIIF